MNYNLLFSVPLLVFFTGLLVVAAIQPFRRVLCVSEGWAGLLYKHGLYVRRINAGRHVIWGRGWTLKLVDRRKMSLAVAGQEILTADNVGLKMSLLISCQVEDPAMAMHQTQNWQGDLYNTAQIALRAVVGGVAMEALLGQRIEIAAQLLARVQPEAAKLGVSVSVVDVRDVTLPADLKRAFGEVLKAKQEGQAALERARGESAALRNLANAARVLEGNPALTNLRFLQSLESAQNAGNTLVLGMPGGFALLAEAIKAAKPT